MRVLGIETSGEWGGVALWDERGLAAEITFRHELQLSRDLAVRIEEALALASWDIASLDGVAVSLGPGSFTGLRIGVTAAKALAYALDIPVIGIGTLEALAAEHSSVSAPLVTLIAASATDSFGVVHQSHGDSPEERMDSVDGWLHTIRELTDPVVVGMLGRHRERFAAESGERVQIAAVDALPRAATIARLGRERLLRGERDSTHALAPHYLRLSTPEVRKQEAARQEAPCPAS